MKCQVGKHWIPRCHSRYYIIAGLVCCVECVNYVDGFLKRALMNGNYTIAGFY